MYSFDIGRLIFVLVVLVVGLIVRRSRNDKRRRDSELDFQWDDSSTQQSVPPSYRPPVPGAPPTPPVPSGSVPTPASSFPPPSATDSLTNTEQFPLADLSSSETPESMAPTNEEEPESSGAAVVDTSYTPPVVGITPPTVSAPWPPPQPFELPEPAKAADEM